MTKKNFFVSSVVFLIIVSGFFLAMRISTKKQIVDPVQNESESLLAYVDMDNSTKIDPEQQQSDENESLVDSVVEALSQKSDITNDVMPDEVGSQYVLHQNVTTTLFWIGEKADDDNKHISNKPSAWDEKWVTHFGGVDSPKKRNGFIPSSFVPNENSFYFALPYNDLSDEGILKGEVKKVVPWAKDLSLNKEESICKNRWIQIMHGDKVAYAQWEDVGPFGEDDKAYVFGTAKPKSKTNDHAGLDLSPAANDYLGLEDIDVVDWRFIDAKDVPDGPWKKTVTTSGVCWKNA